VWYLVSLPILLWLGGSLLLAWYYRGTLTAVWREPVLRRPVLIVESDDWGAGPAEQAEALASLRECLGKLHDRDGNPPVMTLGVVLAVADTASMARSGLGSYRRVELSDPALAEVKEEMLAGTEAGVFALQLHGMEHYRPASLLRAAETDPAVAGWLTGPQLPVTEALPSHLQSRWTDSSSLPSKALAPDEIEALAREETAGFESLLGTPARVVVPPTFQWTEAVEHAWARIGIRALVSPGRRFVGRDAGGALVADGSRQLNGATSDAGIAYLIRDAWFEPALGHSAAKGLEALSERTALGRPTLLETHRFNFLGPQRGDSLKKLEALLDRALQRYPDLAFVSSERLARLLAVRDPQWVQVSIRVRLGYFLARLRRIPRLGRLARLGAFGVPLGLAQRLVGT
jgi:hypothetical protein